MTRNKFRNGVFERDNHRCVICNETAQDAHHILERRLWKDGGYYLDNGASLCGECHIEAEMTVLSCQEIRCATGIDKVLLPEHLYRDNEYDKWGNILLSNKKRLKGELFFDESVQKILARGGVLGQFIDYIKYPRTYHLPWSASRTQDDRTLSEDAVEKMFGWERVIITLKMDGENTSLYSDYYMHARSIDSESHPSQSWVRNYCGQIAHSIPRGWRVCGENVYAKHAVEYLDLPSYFLMFSIWDVHNRCLSWDDTLEWAELLELTVVPVLYDGRWEDIPNWEKVGGLPIVDFDNSPYSLEFTDNEREGYVIRRAASFEYGDFRRSVAKYVRKDHVQETVHNWKHQRIVKNELRSE